VAELSPAAQAVLTAYHQEAIDYIEEWGSFRHKRGMAAALRAAADQAADLQVPWSYAGESYQTYDKGLHAAAEHLRAIAAELEALPND
jgi:acetyl esterase/lipase